MTDKIPSEDWAVDEPTKRISRPYNLKIGLRVLMNNICGPSNAFKQFCTFIPQEIQLNSVSPRVKLGFIGDLMPLMNNKLTIDNSLKDFFYEVDYLICNFEGSLTPGKQVTFGLIHTKEILNILKTIKPANQIVLSSANNHGADFGYNKFLETYNTLKDQGFIVIGRRDEPSVSLDNNIQIAACTEWSNQPCRYLSFLKDIDKHLNKNAAFHILFPHWGYELDLYPHPKHIKRAKILLENWDLIIGHHPHAPSPLTSYKIKDKNKLVAYSLGDFCTGLKFDKYRHGVVVKIEIGPDSNGKWQAGKVNWRFTYNCHVNKSKVHLQMKRSCKYFSM